MEIAWILQLNFAVGSIVDVTDSIIPDHYNMVLNIILTVFVNL
jgi:hypothetical protein